MLSCLTSWSWIFFECYFKVQMLCNWLNFQIHSRTSQLAQVNNYFVFAKVNLYFSRYSRFSSKPLPAINSRVDFFIAGKSLTTESFLQILKANIIRQRVCVILVLGITNMYVWSTVMIINNLFFTK